MDHFKGQFRNLAVTEKDENSFEKDSVNSLKGQGKLKMVELVSSQENIDVKKKENLIMSGKSLMVNKPSMHNVSI